MAESRPELETSSDELDKQCDACRNAGETKTAIVFCKTCRQFQCDTCSGMHKRLPALSDHSVVDMQDFGEDKVIDMKGVDICKTHKNEIKFYCKTHNALCCDRCIISDHLKCNDVGELAEFTKSNADNLKHLQRRIQTRLFRINVDQSTISRVKSNLKKEQEDGLRELGEIKAKITRAFTLMRGNFKSETNNAIAATCKQLDSRMDQNRQLGKNLKSTEAFLNNVTTKGTPEQCFNVLCAVTRDLDKLLLEDQKSLSTCNMNIKFNENLLALADMNDQIASISIKKTEVYAPLTLCFAASINFPWTEGKRTPLITGLDFMHDERIIAVDNYNDKIYIFDGMLKTLSTTKVDKPFDVTAISKDKVTISHGKVISIFKIDTDNSLTRVNQIITKESFFSISARDDQTLVAGTFNSGVPAKLVSLKGEEKDFGVLLSTRKSEFDKSRSTYIPSLNMLVLTDRQSNKCHLWNVEDGVEVVVDDDRIKSPCGVCATSFGHIFVCCHENRMIIQLSPTGKVIKCSTVSILWNEYPVSVAVSSDGKKLAVATIINNNPQQCQLRIFTLT